MLASKANASANAEWQLNQDRWQLYLDFPNQQTVATTIYSNEPRSITKRELNSAVSDAMRYIQSQ